MTWRDYSGQAVFSPDGSKYIRYDISNDLSIFDFDRCSGMLSNPIHIPITDLADTLNGGGGVAVSPNSRFVYVSSFTKAYRFDLWANNVAASKRTIAEWDGFNSPLSTTFYLAQLAPDGNIYLSATNGVNVLHVITNPDFKELSAFRQHAVQLPTYNAFGLPNFPHYRLGPIDGSACDTLGINNLPLAHFRHDQLDSNDIFHRFFTDLSYYQPTSWLWEFGDGQSSTEQYPTHGYTSQGMYEVCLTVANEYGEDKTCQVIDVLLSDVVEIVGSAGFKVYPNPIPIAIGTGLLTIASETLHASDLKMSLVDLTGRRVALGDYPKGTSKFSLDISHVPVGIYLLVISGREGMLHSEKIVLLR